MPRYKTGITVPYSAEDAKYRALVLSEIETARENRDKDHDEFNGQTYLQYYESNAKAARSYLPPKKNDEDTRIVTGVTEDKVNTVLSAVLSYNFEPNFEAFDQNDEMVESLGETMEDMVRKSRELERYNSKRRVFYKEALDQGDAFIEESWIHPVKITKDLFDDVYGSNKFLSYKWKDSIEVLRGEAQTNIIDGRNFFPGNLYQFDLERQPFIVTREEIPYEEAMRLYGNWERWNYVPRTFSPITSQNAGDIYEDYSMYDIKRGYVEVVKIQKKFMNEFQLFLNGVMMLPACFPLSFITGTDEQGMPNYSISRLSINPIGHNFFYSKSIPANTKVKQAVKDELLKLMILKTQQSFKPALANNTGTELAQNVLRPGMVTDDIDPDKIKPIVDAKGVTTSEFNMYEKLGQEIDDVSFNRQFSGQSEAGVKTATEVVEQRRQSMVKLGSVLFGITDFEERLARLRCQTILRYWTQPIDTRIDGATKELKNTYRSISLDSSNREGKKVRKMISFNNELPDKYDLYGESKKIGKKLGKQVSMVVLDPVFMSIVQYLWKVVIVPTERDTTALDKELLLNDIAVTQKLFEPQGIKLNYEYLKREVAKSMRHDPDKFFATNDFAELMMTKVPGEPSEIGSSATNENKKTDVVEDLLRNPAGKQIAENMNPKGRTLPPVSKMANS